MSEKRETVYVTKWALTKGVFEVEAKVNEDGTLVSWGRMSTAYGNWHRTAEGAIKRAEEMRKAKIASLTKQLAKLRKMTTPRVCPPWKEQG